MIKKGILFLCLCVTNIFASEMVDLKKQIETKENIKQVRNDAERPLLESNRSHRDSGKSICLLKSCFGVSLMTTTILSILYWQATQNEAECDSELDYNPAVTSGNKCYRFNVKDGRASDYPDGYLCYSNSSLSAVATTLDNFLSHDGVALTAVLRVQYPCDSTQQIACSDVPQLWQTNNRKSKALKNSHQQRHGKMGKLFKIGSGKQGKR